MTVFARHPTTSHLKARDLVDGDTPKWVLTAADRIVSAPRRSIGRRLLRAGMLVIFLAAIAWAAIGLAGCGLVGGGNEAWLPEWLRVGMARLSAAVGQMMRKDVDAADAQALAGGSVRSPADAPAPPLPPSLGPPPSEPAIQLPAEKPADAAPQVVTTAALPPTATAHPQEHGEQANSNANSKPARSLDSYQLRAEAAGLSPDLSHALLERLSAADYRNAGVAIATAVAETPDDGVYVWPRQRNPGLADFEVRFVEGTAGNCRRYVVNVLKDGWATTAMPMERCGAKRRAVSRD